MLRTISQQLAANSEHELTSNRRATPPPGEKLLKSSKYKAYVRTRAWRDLKSPVNIERLSAKSWKEMGYDGLLARILFCSPLYIGNLECGFVK
jgi:hypothetical protein